jgi:hypothetical protein
MENERLNVDVEGMPVRLALRDGGEGIRADGMPYGASSPHDVSPDTVDYGEDQVEESNAKAVTRQQSRMTSKVTVYDGNGKLLEVRIVRRQEEILSLLDRDISLVFT